MQRGAAETTAFATLAKLGIATDLTVAKLDALTSRALGRPGALNPQSTPDRVAYLLAKPSTATVRSENTAAPEARSLQRRLA